VERTHDMHLAKFAYDKYKVKRNGKSIADGQPIPDFETLPTPIKEAWVAASDAIYSFIESAPPPDEPIS
jgi:hypothetical protein